MKTDVLIVGGGCSGLFCALNLPKDKKITILTKEDIESSDSFLAQGGMCMLKSEDDYQSYFNDTLKAGHFKNDKKSVEIMIKSSPQIVSDLINFGVEFEKDENGDFLFTREGAHSANRILFHKDITGREITSKLYAAAKKGGNIKIITHCQMLDLIENGSALGAVVKFEDGSMDAIYADYTVFATGGIGGLYHHSTNFKSLTGDGVAVCLKHNVETKDLSYIQIHPTTLYCKNQEERSFLISESVRGEGAKLYNKNMQRFVNELLPRDLLSQRIKAQIESDGTDFVWEDLRPVGKSELNSHFPNIVSHCLQKGYDVFLSPIPVVPAQHYFMGGIKVNHSSKTSMERLYAVGETACNGVHGANRLASNSLLESLVFAKRAAEDISKNYVQLDSFDVDIDFSQYDSIQYAQNLKQLVLSKIEEDRWQKIQESAQSSGNKIL